MLPIDRRQFLGFCDWAAEVDEDFFLARFSMVPGRLECPFARMTVWQVVSSLRLFCQSG